MTEIKYSLVIETDQYSGNIERALSGYLFGMCDDHGEHIAKDTILMWERDLSEEQKDLLDNYNIHDYRPHDEYGLIPYDICHGRVEPDKYNAVEFYLEEWLFSHENVEHFQKFIAYLKWRTEKPIEYLEFSRTPVTIKIVDMYIVQRKTETFILEMD